MTWEVYGLVDPRDSVVFYVGYSKHGGAHRHGAHCTDRALIGLESRMPRYYRERKQSIGLCIWGIRHKARCKDFRGAVNSSYPNSSQ